MHGNLRRPIPHGVRGLCLSIDVSVMNSALMNVGALSLFPKSDQFGTCSYNAKSILLYETLVMEAQVHFDCSGFTSEIEIAVCSAAKDFCLPRCLRSFGVHFFLLAFQLTFNEIARWKYFCY